MNAVVSGEVVEMGKRVRTQDRVVEIVMSGEKEGERVRKRGGSPKGKIVADGESDWRMGQQGRRDEQWGS